DGKWSDGGRLEHQYALATALGELVETGLVHGRARAWSLISIGRVRDGRGESARLLELADQALDLARASGDEIAEAGARNLTGSAWQGRGDLAAAKLAFNEELAIRGRLLERSPSNVGWQQGVAATLRSVGGVLEAQGKLEAARAAFEEG